MSTSREALDLEGSLPVWEVTQWGWGVQVETLPGREERVGSPLSQKGGDT